MFKDVEIHTMKEFCECVEVLRLIMDGSDDDPSVKTGRTINDLMKALILYAEEIEMDDAAFIAVIKGIMDKT